MAVIATGAWQSLWLVQVCTVPWELELRSMPLQSSAPLAADKHMPASAGRRPAEAPGQASNTNALCRCRLQVIEQLLMQDGVVQLIQDQISLQEQPRQRTNVVPAALSRPASALPHARTTPSRTLEVRHSCMVLCALHRNLVAKQMLHLTLTI